jgi:hypothetical protein
MHHSKLDLLGGNIAIAGRNRSEPDWRFHARRVCYPIGNGHGASNHTVIAHAIKQRSFTSAP